MSSTMLNTYIYITGVTYKSSHFIRKFTWAVLKIAIKTTNNVWAPINLFGRSRMKDLMHLIRGKMLPR